MPTSETARRRARTGLAALLRPSPELIVVTAAAVSAVNALVVLDIVRLAAAHLAIVNIGLASVLGLVARGLLPRAKGSEGGSAP